MPRDPEKHKEQQRRYYRRHKTKFQARNKRRRQELGALRDTYRNRPCMDCGGDFPLVCMDFDHRDPTQKISGVAEMVNHPVANKTLIAEMEKCDVVCSNCHRIRTHG